MAAMRYSHALRLTLLCLTALSMHCANRRRRRSTRTSSGRFAAKRRRRSTRHPVEDSPRGTTTRRSFAPCILTDVYGPRLTGSPNLKAAQDWVVKETTAWGLKNANLEPWSFGHPGWVNERLSVHVISPVKDALVAEALAWTPGTNGPVTAQAVLLDRAVAADQGRADQVLRRQHARR